MTWPIGEWREALGIGDLCTSRWIHVYTSIELAVFLDPICGDFGQDSLGLVVECEGRCLSDHGLKERWQRVRAVLAIAVPRPTPEQRAYFGILCALTGKTAPKWDAWAEGWRTGADRSPEAAWAAAAWAAAAWAAADSTIDFDALAREALAWVDPVGVKQ